MTFQNTKTTIEHLISKYWIKQCVLLSTRSAQLSVLSDVGLLCILLEDKPSCKVVWGDKRLFLCSALGDTKGFLIVNNKLSNCKTILSHRIYKHIKFVPSYFTVHCLNFFFNKQSYQWNKRDNERWTHVADTIHRRTGSFTHNWLGTRHPPGGYQSLEL